MTSSSWTGMTAAKPESAFMFENIVCDLHWTALHIGVLGALLNAQLQTGLQGTLRPWRHILQDDGSIMKLALRYCEDVGISEQIGARIGALYDQFSVLKHQTAPLVGTPRAYGPNELAITRRLAQKYQRLCADAAQIVNVVAPLLKGRLPTHYYNDGQSTVGFLAETARGDFARVNAKGEIALPPLTQRRKAPRVSVQGACRLVSATHALAARIEDVSRGGMGVICHHAFAEREPITVELEDGRQFKALVVRQNGDRIGLSLLSPLASNDPLISARSA